MGASCVLGPTYLYDCIHQNMATGTSFSSTMRPRSGSGGTKPFLYGEWELTVEIGGVEVDSEAFTLEEDCPSD